MCTLMIESWTRELDHKKGWVPKNCCFQTVVLEKTLESPLDCKEIKPVKPKGNQPWIFIGRTDAEAEAPILYPPDVKSWLTGKNPDARKDWEQEEKGTTEDEMVGWHYRLNGHEFEQAPGDSEGQGSLVFCSAWGRKESDTTELLHASGPDSAGFVELPFLPYLLYNFSPKNDIITQNIWSLCSSCFSHVSPS